MKKAVLLIATLCYLAVSSGVMISSHYCMDRRMSSSLYGISQVHCGTCGMDMHGAKGCCRDEVKLVKMTDDQNRPLVSSFELPSLSPVLLPASPFLSASLYNAATTDLTGTPSPPLLAPEELYLQNRVFRI